MNIRQFEVFLAVMENASVTRSAEKLVISPGAVSLQLQGLAAELGTELFVRSGKRLAPTPHAFRLAERAREIMRTLQEIQQEFENDPSRDERPFHFATGATTLIHRLGRPLRQLRKKFPRAQVYVTVVPTESIVAGLVSRRFDLGLISLPWPEQDLKIESLFEEELLVLRPSPTRTGHGNIATIQPSELASVPFLLYPKHSNMRGMIDRFFAELGLSPRVMMEADDTEAIKRMVECGFGYSILPQFALRDRPSRFQTMRVAGHRLVRQQALAMTRSDYPRALTMAVADFLKNSLREG
ncbi:MAG TPA: LysR family transcriptional regulator [Bryobacteraceae bacterium]|nr:LysR family transcriptional regulator [Bryobacteraceae bacterium]